ncbi:hypothetical protein J1614_001124 [Plenodomus biglobosus]|nr:hypothetical protein J1614_001124 [Plenodomus biglobosus]
MHPPIPKADSIDRGGDGASAHIAAQIRLPNTANIPQEFFNRRTNMSSPIQGNVEQDDIKESIEHGFDSPLMSVGLPELEAPRLNDMQDEDMDDLLQQHQNESQEQSHESKPTGPTADRSEDSSTLFVSETSPSLPPATQRPSTFRPMAAPTRPRTQSRVGTPAQDTGVFNKIRSMQANIQRKKDLASRRALVRKSNIEPDNETYLDAVLSRRLPDVPGFPSVDEDQMSDRQALAEFEKQKRYYDNLRNNSRDGELSFRHDIEWIRIKGAEEARRRKRARDIAKAREDGEEKQEIFPEIRPTTLENAEDGSDHDFDFDRGGPRKRARRDAPRKQGKHASMIDAELQSMRVGMEAHEEASVKKKKDKGPADSLATSSQNKTTKPKTRSRPSRAKGAPKWGQGKSARNKREVEHAAQQASSLFNSNVFAQQAGPNAAEQPGFTSNVKTTALKELIASVPLGSMKKARSEMNVLLGATKDFDGRGSVRSVPGTNLWLVKGMKTSLKHYQILGSAFMRRRENSMEEPRGGLLADQMGLGKTLMMLGKVAVTLNDITVLTNASKYCQWTTRQRIPGSEDDLTRC